MPHHLEHTVIALKSHSSPQYDYIKKYSAEDTYSLKGLYDTYRPSEARTIIINDIVVKVSKSTGYDKLIATCILFESPKLYNFTGEKESLKDAMAQITADIVRLYTSSLNTKDIIQKGRDMKPVHKDISKEVSFKLPKSKGTLHDRYIETVNSISDITRAINIKAVLQDSKDVADVFMDTKTALESLAITPVKQQKKGFMSKYFGKPQSLTVPSGKKESVQNNIDYLFGVVHTSYEKLVETGEQLQESKGKLIAQLTRLEELKEESNIEVSNFPDKASVPMRTLALNTQITASAEKYKDRILKIDGAILATQTTIISLGKDLPSMKSDLTDEMAISGMLSGLEDYQLMYAEIAELVSKVTTSTSEKTFERIESVLDMQISDTHTIDYLTASAERGEKFAEMITEKSQLLVEKTQNDAKIIAKIAEANSLTNARNSIKQIEG